MLIVAPNISRDKNEPVWNIEIFERLGVVVKRNIAPFVETTPLFGGIVMRKLVGFWRIGWKV